MAKSANQKLKLLYLAQTLQQESDETHPMTVNALIMALGRHGVAAERKSIYDDMEALSQFGLDVVTLKGRGNAYYLGERDFQLPELKLLVDAVQSAKFISAGKSRDLIRKICGLTSRHEGSLMQRQVHVQGQAKTVNERTYYNVDAIQNAIAENRQIQFFYFEWAVDPASPRLFTRRRRRDGNAYVISPWSLLWDDEFYYLIAWDDAAQMIKHYRVDKMTEIRLCEVTREGRAAFEALDMGEYTKRVFGMFGGEEADVRLRFENSLIGVVVDRFGTDVIIHKSGNEHFTVNVKAVVSPQFLSWIFGFGKAVQVLSPQSVIDHIRAEIVEIANVYKAAE